jgi:O-antigen/teichoic acid export membrane protein
MANKVPKPSRERGLLSGVALALALALVASLLYVQPVIRAYWWIAAVKLPLHALHPAGNGRRRLLRTASPTLTTGTSDDLSKV